MKRALSFCGLALFVGLQVTGCGGGPMTPDTAALATAAPVVEPARKPTIEELGRGVVKQLADGEHQLVVARFNAKMQSLMSTTQLAELWTSLEAQVGSFETIVEVDLIKRDGFDVVSATTAFRKAVMDVRVVFDGEQRIAGLQIKPSSKSKSYPPPPYARIDNISESEVTVGSGKWALPGTFSAPKGKSSCPAVVLVHGSGPNDRDETVGPNKPFKDLALGLATLGVCVLRYDKRTKHHGARIVEELGDDITLQEETIDDVRLAVTLLEARKDVDAKRIFVLGHSLGGHAIPRIAKQDQRIRGFIIMAGSSMPLEDSIMGQMQYITSLDGTISDSEKAVIKMLQAQVDNVKNLKPSSKIDNTMLPLAIAPPYWLDLAQHPPAKLIASEKRPILVLHGDRDYQVTEKDLKGWTAALSGKPNAAFKRYPKLNHLFIAGEGKSAPPEYLQQGYVDEQVVADIAAWIGKN